MPLDPMQLEPAFWPFLIATVVKMLVVFTLYMIVVAYSTLAERKVSAWIQDRHGPNRVGPWGLFQVLADGVKNFVKEESMPGDVNRPTFLLAPAIAFTMALTAWAVIPFGAPLPTPWGQIELILADAGRPDRRALPARDHLAGRLRHRARRMVIEQQVFLARWAARLGPDGEL